MTGVIREVQEFQMNGWTIRPCHDDGADGFDLLHGHERTHHDHLETAVAAAQASPRGGESRTAEMLRDGRIDPLRIAAQWVEDLKRSTSLEAVSRRLIVEELMARINRYEKNMPSWAHGRPEDYDAWLRELTPDDRRLMFYQWIGEQAVREAIAEFKENLRNDPAPREHQHYDQEAVEELLEVIDPDHGPIALPSKLPLGHPFCDVDHHTHIDGGGRLPTCRLDSAE